MGLVKPKEAMPVWGALRRFSRHIVAHGKPLVLPAQESEARLLSLSGFCLVSNGSMKTIIRPYQFLDLPKGRRGFEASALDPAGADVMLFEGSWAEEVGGCGVFEYSNDTPKRNESDPVDYPKSTTFDSHYHDFDEYFLILEGEGICVIGTHSFDVGPGDCVAIGMGHHHDIPVIRKPIRSAYFHGPLEGQRRPGHLWTYKNGPALPQRERV
jgi:mannose-6-phosphate isomerase-like protein (cupin superfamily)